MKNNILFCPSLKKNECKEHIVLVKKDGFKYALKKFI